MSARSVAASYKPPMLVTRVRLSACALFFGFVFCSAPSPWNSYVFICDYHFLKFRTCEQTATDRRSAQQKGPSIDHILAQSPTSQHGDLNRGARAQASNERARRLELRGARAQASNALLHLLCLSSVPLFDCSARSRASDAGRSRHTEQKCDPVI